MQIPFYKKILSFFIPVTLEKTIGNNMTVLLVQLYVNQCMLVTPRAIYSYGTRYNPFRKPFAGMQHELKKVNSFLLLGTGLGSALSILQKKYALFPEATLVDNDEDVLNFSQKYMDLNSRANVEWICQDAVAYLNSTSRKFDLMGVDIFKDLVQPNFVTTTSFFAHCAAALQPNGTCIFNMILEDDNKIIDIQKALSEHFAEVTFILDKVNTYFICRR